MTTPFDPFTEAAAPLPPGRTVLRDVEFAHFRSLLQHRTNPDGSAKKGFTRNVLQLRTEIARLESRDTADAVEQTDAVATETLPEPVHA